MGARKNRKRDNADGWEELDRDTLGVLLEEMRGTDVKEAVHPCRQAQHPVKQSLLPEGWVKCLGEAATSGDASPLSVPGGCVPDDEVLVDERDVVDTIALAAMLDRLSSAASLEAQPWWDGMSTRYADERDPSTITRIDKEAVKVVCPDCKKEHDVPPTELFAREGDCICPRCREKKRRRLRMQLQGPSRGERLVEKVGTSLGLVVDRETRFSECVSRHGCPLRFDATFYAKAGTALAEVLLVEYDGQHHFAPIASFGGQAAFEEQVERDMIKSKFCVDNGHTLVRVPYLASTEEAVGEWITAVLAEDKHFSTYAA